MSDKATSELEHAQMMLELENGEERQTEEGRKQESKVDQSGG